MPSSSNFKFRHITSYSIDVSSNVVGNLFNYLMKPKRCLILEWKCFWDALSCKKIGLNMPKLQLEDAIHVVLSCTWLIMSFWKHKWNKKSVNIEAYTGHFWNYSKLILYYSKLNRRNTFLKCNKERLWKQFDHFKFKSLKRLYFKFNTWKLS